jgi:hypothetical protein
MRKLRYAIVTIEIVRRDPNDCEAIAPASPILSDKLAPPKCAAPLLALTDTWLQKIRQTYAPDDYTIVATISHG